MALQLFNPNKEVEIVEFEERIGFKLPSDYRTFMLQSNGAKVIDGIVHIKDLNEDVLMDTLYGINTENKELSIEFWLKEFEDEMPEKTLIIGDDAGGGLIIFIMSKENYGVYYWDDSFSFDQSNETGNTYFIAETFIDFLNIIK